MGKSAEIEGTGTKEIAKQIEAYTFQVKAIAWQVLISIFVTVAVYFLGAGNYSLFFICLGLAGVFFIAVVVDYLGIRFNIISRERGMNTSELRWFRTLVRDKKYVDAERFLKAMTDATPKQKSELINALVLLKKFESIIQKKNLSETQLRKIASSNGLTLLAERYRMTDKELEIMIYAVSNYKSQALLEEKEIIS